MSETRTDTPSVIERARDVEVGGAVVGAHVLGRTVVFVLGEEAVVLAEPGGRPRRLSVHGGAILSSAADWRRVVTGGDDGKVMEIVADAAPREVAADPKGRWIDHVAAGPDGAIAWSAGKQAFAWRKDRENAALELPSTVGGLAFAPKGMRIAVAHYNGVTLWFPNAPGSAPQKLEWAGSHLDVSFSPDNRFVVTAMQEPTLLGWRLADGKSMRVAGYTARVRSMSWSADGHWLATSSADPIVLWPFQSKEGPMGKQPRMLCAHQARVSAVACHPKHGIVAAGYGDGLLLIVRIEDGAEILARKPAGDPVSALGWSADGTLLAFGTEDGAAGIIELG